MHKDWLTTSRINLARYGSAIDHVSFSSNPFNLGHYMEEFISQMMEVSIKQIYGWVAYACIFLFLLLLLYDFPVRRSLKSMPSWKDVAREVKNTSGAPHIHRPEKRNNYYYLLKITIIYIRSTDGRIASCTPLYYSRK